MLSGKKVAVTGAGGFIGSHLTEKLVGLGADVKAFVHYNSQGTRGWLDTSDVVDDIEIVAGDIADQDSVRNLVKGCDIVFHLAALIGIPYSYVAPRAYVSTNITGTLNVLQAARDLGIDRVVHTSTSETYGTALYAPIDEKHPLQGQSPYSASKIGADKLAESYYLSFELPVVTVRPFNTFGPRQSTRAVIPTIITQCLVGDVVKLGNVHPLRDLNYVTNTADGFIAAATSDKAVGDLFNIGYGEEISIGDLASKIATLMGKDITIESDSQRLRPEGSEVDRLLAETSKAREILNWSPAVSQDEGLSRTIEWLTAHLDKFRPGEYTV
ncbi:MAG: NAD-dependent 4,6-dehydratase LegB [Phototrophicaceae bacterium]